MRHSKWIVTALILQLILVVFAPPFFLGGRTLFFSDLWTFVWLPPAVFLLFRQSDERSQKNLTKLIIVSAMIAALAFAHGASRISMISGLKVSFEKLPDDRFAPIKEFVVAFRFLSWFLAAVVIAKLKPPTLLLCRALAAIMLTSSLILILIKVHPAYEIYLGRIYSYVPHSEPWPDRVSGVFRSPVEGSIALGFSLLVLLTGSWARPALRATTSCVLLIGVLLTHTITSLVALLITALLIAVVRLRRPWGWIISLGSLMAMSGFAALFWKSAFFSEKWGNFLYRFAPWKIFIDVGTSRWDLFLLGTGFNPHFVDNIYLFLFNRGGVVLLAGLGGYLAAQIIPRWKTMSWHSRSIVIFLLVSGLTIDNLIMRPLASILIAVAIPLLAQEVATGLHDEKS